MSIEPLTNKNALPLDEITVSVDNLAVSIDTEPELPSPRTTEEILAPEAIILEQPAQDGEAAAVITPEVWQALSVKNKLKLQKEWVEKFQAGDIRSFAYLYEFYRPTIYRYLRARTDEINANDITQTVFLKCYEKIGDFTDKGHGIEPWLYSIARNKLIDEYARRSKYTAADLDDEEIMALANRNSYESIEERVLSKISLEKLLPALAELPTAAQYEAVTEVYLRGKTLAEYAEETGESVDAIKQRLQRAKVHLRPLITRLLSED